MPNMENPAFGGGASGSSAEAAKLSNSGNKKRLRAAQDAALVPLDEVANGLGMERHHLRYLLRKWGVRRVVTNGHDDNVVLADLYRLQGREHQHFKRLLFASRFHLDNGPAQASHPLLQELILDGVPKKYPELFTKIKEQQAERFHRLAEPARGEWKNIIEAETRARHSRMELQRSARATLVWVTVVAARLNGGGR